MHAIRPSCRIHIKFLDIYTANKAVKAVEEQTDYICYESITERTMSIGFHTPPSRETYDEIVATAEESARQTEILFRQFSL